MPGIEAKRELWESGVRLHKGWEQLFLVQTRASACGFCLWQVGMFVKGIKACPYANTPCPYPSVCPGLELSLVFLIE